MLKRQAAAGRRHAAAVESLACVRGSAAGATPPRRGGCAGEPAVVDGETVNVVPFAADPRGGRLSCGSTGPVAGAPDNALGGDDGHGVVHRD